MNFKSKEIPIIISRWQAAAITAQAHVQLAEYKLGQREWNVATGVTDPIVDP